MRIDIINLVTRLTRLEEQNASRERQVADMVRQQEIQRQENAALREELERLRQRIANEPNRPKEKTAGEILSEWMLGAEKEA